MKKNLFQYVRNSLLLKLFIILSAAVLPTAALLLYNIHLSRETLVDQMVTTHRNLLESYAMQIETQLDAASLYLIRHSFYDNDIQIVSNSTNGTDIQYAYQRILDSQDSHLTSTDYLDGIFTYVRQQDGTYALLLSTNYKHPSLSQKSLRTFLEEIHPAHENDADTSSGLLLSGAASWDLVSIDGTDYLFYITGPSEDCMYAGAYVRVEQLLSSFEQADTELLLFPADAKADVEKSLSADLLLTTATLKDTLCLGETFSRSSITSSLPTLPRYGTLELIAVFALFVLFIYELNHLVLFPILHLAESMHKIELGAFDTRVSETTSSTEMHILHHSFNVMLDKIQNLTINVVNEQLKNQKAQLRNLQMQIKPHFLINSLNMIYNLIETDQPSTARRLIQYTIDYFRYMTIVDKDLVPLNEEIDHIRAYLEIQQLRYKNMFSYQIDVDRMVEDMQIPPMTIQNFVENSIKYALNTAADSETEKMHISVTVSSFEREDYPYATITVHDNGAGYPESMLADLNQGRHIYKKDGSHIGLRNTTQRLSILFGDQVQWQFYNDHGAVSSVTMPVTFPEEEDVN